MDVNDPAWRRIVEQLPRLYSVVRRKTGASPDVVENGVADAIVQHIERKGSVVPKVGLLCRAAVRRIIDAQRKAQRERDAVEAMARLSSHESPEEVVQHREELRAVGKALQELSEQERTYVLRRASGYSNGEIAGGRCKKAAVASSVAHGRKRLRDLTPAFLITFRERLARLHHVGKGCQNMMGGAVVAAALVACTTLPYPNHGHAASTPPASSNQVHRNAVGARAEQLASDRTVADGQAAPKVVTLHPIAPGHSALASVPPTSSRVMALKVTDPKGDSAGGEVDYQHDQRTVVQEVVYCVQTGVSLDPYHLGCQN